MNFAEGFVLAKILKQLIRIADALELQAGLDLTKEEKSSAKNSTFELVETSDEDLAKDEREEKQKKINEIVSKNEGNFLFAEDNIETDILEDL